MAVATDGGLRPLHHITRIDIAPSAEHPDRHATHGWQVRARRAGERLSKFFADARHGSPEAALEAAVVYRDHLLAALPPPPAVPRKAWSNTGVVGLSVREKDEARPKLYVQINWVTAEGRRRASAYSVEKWGLRRALWNGCLRLYRERQAAGAPVEEPHVMFARAQEPFADLIREEIEAEQAAAPTRAVPAASGDGEATPVPPRPVPTPTPPAARGSLSEADAVRRIEDALFG